MKLRTKQLEGVNECIESFKTDNKFRFVATTGAGKTLMAIEVAKRICPEGYIVVSTHTDLLRDQFDRAIKGQFKNCIVSNYQSLRTMYGPCDLLIVDEVHQGGQTANGSYAKIMNNFKPKFILSLSATDKGVDEGLFGRKKHGISLKHQYQVGLANPVNLISINTGLIQTLNDGTQIEAEGIAELLDQDNKKGVDLQHRKSVDAIIKAAILSAMKKYIKYEKGNQALFYVPNIELANWTLTQVPKDIRAEVSHSKIKDKSVFKRFKRNKFELLIVVYQAREGFNYPALEVIFDCAPSFTNGGRDFIQKSGRITRDKKGKATSRYYILNRVNKYIKNLPAHVATRMLAEECIQNEKEDVKVLTTEIPVAPEIVEEYPELFNGKELSSKKAEKEMFSSALFIVKAEKDKNVQTHSLSHLLQTFNLQDPDGNKAELLRMAKAGEPKPKKGEKMYCKLQGYIGSKSETYDAIFKKELYSSNESWIPNNSNKNKIILLEMARRGDPKPKPGDPLYIKLINYTSKTGKMFDKKFRDELYSLNKGWKPNNSDKQKIILLNMAKKGDPRPGKYHKLYNILNKYTYLKSIMYDAIFTKKLYSFNKEWDPKYNPKNRRNKKYHKNKKLKRNS